MESFGVTQVDMNDPLERVLGAMIMDPQDDSRESPCDVGTVSSGQLRKRVSYEVKNTFSPTSFHNR